jgi:hypothetical protein
MEGTARRAHDLLMLSASLDAIMFLLPRARRRWGRSGCVGSRAYHSGQCPVKTQRCSKNLTRILAQGLRRGSYSRTTTDRIWPSLPHHIFPCRRQAQNDRDHPPVEIPSFVPTLTTTAQAQSIVTCLAVTLFELFISTSLVRPGPYSSDSSLRGRLPHGLLHSNPHGRPLAESEMAGVEEELAQLLVERDFCEEAEVEEGVEIEELRSSRSFAWARLRPRICRWRRII